MNGKRIVAICLAALLSVGVLLIPGTSVLAEAAGGTLSTDNMSISWDETGKISSVILQGKEMIVPCSSGFVITDAATSKEYAVNIPVTGGKEKTQSGAIDGANLKFEVTYRQKGHAIYVEGTVTDTSKTDRLIRLDYILPVSSEGMYWYDDISTTKQVKANGAYSKVTDYFISGHKMSMYPYGTVSNGNQAVALGVPMDPAQSFLIGYKTTGGLQAMTMRFNFALSEKTKKIVSKADFSFVIYAPTEPEWGFRSASQDYYDLFPEYFEVKSNGGGNWLFQHAYEGLYGIEDFYFGYNETPGSYKADEENGVASFVYTAPAEMWLQWPGMPKEPEPTYEQYLGRLNDLLNDNSGAIEPGFEPLTQKNFAEAMKNSAILLENGIYHTVGWYAYGVSVCFVTNHNPDIPGWNAFKAQMEKIKATEVEKSSGLTRDGVYIDNLTGISGLNYREDHFAYVDTPLLWNTSTKQLLIPGYSSMYSYTKAIREYCDEKNQLILANMVHPGSGITQYIHMVDVPGSECGPDWGWLPSDQRLRRTMAYRKPWMLLLGHATGNSGNWGASEAAYEAKEDVMKSAIAYGLFANVIGYRVPMSEYEVSRPLFRKYTYIAVVQDKLGWNPITYATPSGTGYVECERFGDLGKGAAIFTVYNTGKREMDFNGVLNIDLNAMKLTEQRAKKLLAYDMVNNTFVPISIKDGVLTYDVDLALLDLSAIMIGTKEEIFEWMFERIKGTLERGNEAADDISAVFKEAEVTAPSQWTDLTNKLNAVGSFAGKKSADALKDVKTLIAGMEAVNTTVDTTISALPAYTNRLEIDVKNIYGDSYAILNGLFGADGNKDHSGLNKYEGVMDTVPDTDPDTDAGTDSGDANANGSNGSKGSNANTVIIIVCAVLVVLIAAGGAAAFLLLTKKK